MFYNFIYIKRNWNTVNDMASYLLVFILLMKYKRCNERVCKNIEQDVLDAQTDGA